MSTIEKVRENTLDLSGAIDYIIFNQPPVYIIWEGNDEPVPALLIDHDSKYISLKNEKQTGVNLEPGLKGTVHTSYKSKQLKFELIIDVYESLSGVAYCIKPKKGLLVNNREYKRSRFFVKDSTICAVFTVDTINGPTTFKTSKLIDFSAKNLSLLIDREQGLLLPDDNVSELRLIKGNQVIFQAKGEVLRIESGNMKTDSLFAVIGFIDPDARPKYDIYPNERRSERVVMTGRQDTFIEFYHPLLSETVTSYVYDLSISGLSIRLSSERITLIPGLMIPEASLQLPLRPRMIVSLKVVEINEDNTNKEIRVSFEFEQISSTLAKEVAAFVQQCVSDHLCDANGVDYDELWEFFFETGFIYNDKRRQLQNYHSHVRETQRILLKTNTPILKKILYKEDGKIVGSGAALKIYDNTLMLQHLNTVSTNSGAAAKAIIRGMTTFFLDYHANAKIENRYVCTYFQPNKLFPSLVFGQSATEIGDPNICWTLNYNFCLSNHLTYIPESSGDYDEIIIREANEDDMRKLETALIDSSDYRLLRLEGLTRESLTRMKIFDEYKNIGLYRYRRVFVAEDIDKNCCFAVCSYSSPGINLSELTNSVKFVYDTKNHNIQQRLTNAITPSVLASYQQSLMKDPVFLIKQNEPIPAGFTVEKIYTLWSMDALYPKLFKHHVDNIFSNIKEFIRKNKAANG